MNRTRAVIVPACVLVLVGCGRYGIDPVAEDANAGLADAPEGADAATPTPPRFVQHDAGKAAGAAVVSVAFTAPVTAGDLIVAGFDYDIGAPVVSSVTDGQGNAFALIGPHDSTWFRQYVAYAIATSTGPDTVTVMLDASSASFLELRLHEYANVSTTDPFDVAAGAAGTSTAPDGAQSPAINTSSVNELIFGMVIDGAVTAGTGFTTRGTDFADLTEDRIAQTPGPYRVIATATGAWDATAVAFRGR